MTGYVLKCINKNSQDYEKYLHERFEFYVKTLDQNPAIFSTKKKAKEHAFINDMVVQIELAWREVKI